MGLGDWYDANIVPKVIGCACGMGQVMKRRSLVVPLAKGDVFELGCGCGINQEFYDVDAVTSYAGIDPHEGMLETAREAAAKKGWPDHMKQVDMRQGIGEDIPFADNSFDTVVCTFTLCSVQEPAQVLSEMRRILRPAGTALFLEHGRAPDASVAKWQDRIEPLWKHLAGGCHLTRPISSAFANAGFEVEELGRGYMPKSPRWAMWNEWGAARKVGE
ncbi:class I SAM-dependent methyltransferase [Erythrobacter sp. SCSIO 43205]|uniref:class I SAM-dependent methyltransferase n=1 Tax=Erythrobacter sp. SCSIO 43205 TaxID=2779361 RepID=UPI001CA82284|nr:class I SAM-dependent methyltransferase [Erythrobacter sp. SCSIO 43205]UAB77260.1 class I SAM-dependent methyltransferase [Erythrobacter sp. SCSIO 43205]